MDLKLTDEAVSRLPLGAGRAELLEEIMSTVAPERQQAEPVPTRRRGWLVPLAAAAVVAGIAGTALTGQQDEPREVAPAADAAPVGEAVGETVDAGTAVREVVVLDAPGWRVDRLSDGEVVFRKGAADLQVGTYDAADYDSYVEDREHISDPPGPGEPIEVLGRPAQLWAYSATDHTAIREVEDGRWLELRGAGMDRAAYLALLGELRLTSQQEFEAALPGDYVRQDQRQGRAEQILAGIETASGSGFPRGEAPSFAAGESKDGYQFAAEVVGAYTCAWLEEYDDAVTRGQAGRVEDALTVLSSAHGWPILQEMEPDGGYSGFVYQLADEAQDGELQPQYLEGFGCGGPFIGAAEPVLP